MKRRRRSVEQAHEETVEGREFEEPLSFRSRPRPHRRFLWVAAAVAGGALGAVLAFLRGSAPSSSLPPSFSPPGMEANPPVVEAVPVSPSALPTAPPSSPGLSPPPVLSGAAAPAASPEVAGPSPSKRARGGDPFAYAPVRSAGRGRAGLPPLPALPPLGEVPPPLPPVELLGVARGARPSAVLRLGGEVFVLSPGERVALGEGPGGGSLVLLGVSPKGVSVLFGGKRVELTLGGER